MALIELDFRSGSLNYHEEVFAVLPKGKAEMPYPVLWLMHTEMNDCSQWLRSTALERYADKYGIAVIMPTYTNSFGTNMKHGFDYYTMLSRELPPAIRSMLPCLSEDPSENFVAGASFGGYIACKMLLEKPDAYAAAGIFGAVLDPEAFMKKELPDFACFDNRDLSLAFGSPEEIKDSENDLFFLAKGCAGSGKKPLIWSLCGDSDPLLSDLNSSLDRLKESGAEVCRQTAAGGHSFDVWDLGLEAFMRWLPLKGGRA